MLEGLLFPSLRFFMGPFEQLLSSEGGDVDSFKAAVGSFFSKFVHTIKPAAACIHDIFRAIQGGPSGRGIDYVDIKLTVEI